jgi:hypothetical protein
MKRSFLFLLISAFPAIGHCEVSTEIFCFGSFDPANIRFELRTYSDSAADWEGAFVKYKGAKHTIPLVLLNDQAETIDKNSPDRDVRTWAEVNDGKITGEYEMVSQGTDISSMTYLNHRTGKKFHFLPDSNVDRTDKGCSW